MTRVRHPISLNLLLSFCSATPFPPPPSTTAASFYSTCHGSAVACMPVPRALPNTPTTCTLHTTHSALRLRPLVLALPTLRLLDWDSVTMRPQQPVCNQHNPLEHPTPPHLLWSVDQRTFTFGLLLLLGVSCFVSFVVMPRPWRCLRVTTPQHLCTPTSSAMQASKIFWVVGFSIVSGAVVEVSLFPFTTPSPRHHACMLHPHALPPTPPVGSRPL